MSDLDIYDVVIVGGGLSSLFLARELSHKKILIVDKAKSLGGRAATRRIGNLSVNQGLDHFVLTDPKLKKWIDLAIDKKILEISDSDVRAPQGINQWAKSLGEGIPFASQASVASFAIKETHIEVYDSIGGIIAKCRKIVLTPPAPQAKSILEKSNLKADFLSDVLYSSSLRHYILTSKAIDGEGLKLLKQQDDSFLYLREISHPLSDSEKTMSREELHHSFVNSLGISDVVIIDSFTHRWLYSQVIKPIAMDYQLTYKDKNIFLLGDSFSNEGVNGIMGSVVNILPFI